MLVPTGSFSEYFRSIGLIFLEEIWQNCSAKRWFAFRSEFSTKSAVFDYKLIDGFIRTRQGYCFMSSLFAVEEKHSVWSGEISG